MKTIKLLDGTVINNVKLGITFSLNCEEFDENMIEVHLEGDMVSGWYSNVIGLGDLSRFFGEDELVMVKFILGKMNSSLRI